MPFVETTPHDEAQPAPDVLTSLVINHLWRRHVAAALTTYFERVIGTRTDDPDINTTRENFHRLLLDLYDREIVAIMRLCTIHADPGVIYPSSSITTLFFNPAETPFFFDPDNLYQFATSTFRASSAGAWALFLYFDIVNAGNSYTLHIRKVGETAEFALSHVIGGGGAEGHGLNFAIFHANPGDEFVMEIETGLLDIEAQYGYAAFVLLGEL